MFDPITLLAGAGIAAAGWAVGRYSRRRSEATPKSVARCGCGHDLAMHDPQDGVCHAENRRKDMSGLRVWVPCGCRRYTGPQPLEELFSRPILPPQD